MSEINDIDFEEDQQQILEKTDIKTLSHYCLMLQNFEDQISNMEKDIKKIKSSIKYKCSSPFQSASLRIRAG